MSARTRAKRARRADARQTDERQTEARPNDTQQTDTQQTDTQQSGARQPDARKTEARSRTEPSNKTDRRRRAHERGSRQRLVFALGGAAIFALGAFVFVRPAVEPSVAPPVAYASPVRGEATAPVTIVEYADFQCPSCGAFFRSVEPRLVQEYVRTGKAKLVFKNFAWIGEESRRAAEAAACAGAQGKFWEYHDALYSNQRGENHGAFAAANLKRFATQLGLDQAAFDACVDGRAYRAAVEADMNEVRSQGFTGTPTFLINGQRIVGAQAYGVFASTIEAKLAGR